MHISELITDAEFREAYPVLHELRTHLTPERYAELLRMMIPRGYRLFAVRDGADDAIVALAGIGIETNLYHGRHVWVYELVTTTQGRSKGYGAALMAYLEDFARDNGCEGIALASGLQRVDAHRFYETKAMMNRMGYIFHKKLG